MTDERKDGGPDATKYQLTQEEAEAITPAVWNLCEGYLKVIEAEKSAKVHLARTLLGLFGCIEYEADCSGAHVYLLLSHVGLHNDAMLKARAK